MTETWAFLSLERSILTVILCVKRTEALVPINDVIGYEQMFLKHTDNPTLDFHAHYKPIIFRKEPIFQFFITEYLQDFYSTDTGPSVTLAHLKVDGLMFPGLTRT